ncbi:MAG: AAA family ATPase [Candidatus Thermoplasmatota archaeon]|nr:AAA family ATPase [Candidatus Thermoplasmatota archaeon]
MRINTIELYNYRVFYGKHRLVIGPEEGGGKSSPSLAVIIGRNGSGKSVILDSVVFALFGLDRRSGNIEAEYKSVMNRHARTLGQKKCYVHISLSIDNREFGLTREIRPSGNSKITVTVDGAVGDQDELSAVLRNHISPESAKYLFFSFRAGPGEKICLSSRDAINSFLGIDILENTKRNLALYHKKVFHFVERNTRAKELSGIKRSMKALKKKRKILRDQAEQRSEMIRKLKREHGTLMKEAYKIRGLGRVIDLHQRIQKKMFTLKKELSEERKNQRNRYDLAPYFLMSEGILSALERMKDRIAKQDTLRYKTGRLDSQLELVETFFEPCISTGKCGFCDSPIKKTSETTLEVNSLKSDLKAELESMDKEMEEIKIPPNVDIDKVQETVYMLDRYKADLKQLITGRRDKIAKIKRLKKAARNLLVRFPTLAKVGTSPGSDIRFKDFVTKISRKRVELNDARIDLARTKQQLKDIKAQYGEHFTKFRNITLTMRASINRYLKKADMSVKVIQAITSAIKEIQTESRGAIEAGLNKILSGIFSKKGVIERVVLKKSDYSMAVKISSEGENKGRRAVEVNEFSDGERVLIFISLVWALNRMRGGSTILYDSPFCYLDSKNKGSIVRPLSRLPGNQVILTTKDDLSGVYDDLLIHADRIYDINYNEELKSSTVVARKIRTVTSSDELKWVPVSHDNVEGIP